MEVLVLQHAPFEGIGNISPRLSAAGAAVRTAPLFEDPSVPPAEGVDLLIAMGGPMSVNDETRFPWLREEKQMLRRAIQAGVPVLGICLGAQLIASALGARVYLHETREIGWFPVERVDSPAGSFGFPSHFDAFHWHGETFELPPGAVHLARTRACENQAFQVGRNVIGLQFHLEVTPEAVQGMIEHGAEDLAQGGPFVQSADEMRAPAPSPYAAIDRLMGQILGYLTG